MFGFNGSKQKPEILMPDGSSRPQPAYLDKPQSEWTEAESLAHGRFQDEVLAMQKAGKRPRPEELITRQCGFIEDHGAFGTKCWKPQGHEGAHEGGFVGPEDLKAALALQAESGFVVPGNVARTDYRPGQVAMVNDLSQLPATQKPHEPTSALAAIVTREVMSSPALASLRSDMASIARRFETFESNVHSLNLVAGQLVEKIFVPLKAELEALKYNTGDKANGVMSQMERIATHLDAQLGLALKLRGATQEQADNFRDNNGIQLEVLSSSEFEMQAMLENLRSLLALAQRENGELRGELLRVQSIEETRQ